MKDLISVSVLIDELTYMYQAHFSNGLIKWIHHVGNFSEHCIGALGKAQLTFVTVFSTLIQHTKVPCHNNY